MSPIFVNAFPNHLFLSKGEKEFSDLKTEEKTKEDNRSLVDEQDEQMEDDDTALTVLDPPRQVT